MITAVNRTSIGPVGIKLETGVVFFFHVRIRVTQIFSLPHG